MPLSVPTGFKLDQSSIQEFLGLTEEWKPFIRLDAIGKTGAHLAREAARIIDRTSVRAHKSLPLSSTYFELSPFKIVSGQLHSLIREKGPRRIHDPAMDLDFDIQLYIHEGQIYGSLGCAQRDWHEKWLYQSCIEDFSYQNSVDKPKTISEEDWQRRKDVWSSIFRQPGVEPNASLSASIFSMDSLLYENCLDAAIAHLPSFDDRLDFIAREIFLDEVFQMLPREKRISTVATSSVIFKTQDYLRTKDGQRDLKKIKRDHRELLTVEITKKGLLSIPERPTSIPTP